MLPLMDTLGLTLDDRANSNDHITQHFACGISSTNENIDGRIEFDGVFSGGKH